jgi:hypothetical protein
MMTNSSWCIASTTKRCWHLSLSERVVMHRWERSLRLLRECLFALPLRLTSRNYEQHCVFSISILGNGLRASSSEVDFRRTEKGATSNIGYFSTWIVQLACSTDKNVPNCVQLAWIEALVNTCRLKR